MRSLKRNKRTLYLAKYLVDGATDYMSFDTPIEVSVNFSAASSFVDRETFGENYVNVRRSNIGLDLKDVFHENDRVYLTDPTVFSALANDADYSVTSVIDSINGYIVTYEKMSGSDA